MEHHVQALLALSIASALCLAAWIWARRSVHRHGQDVKKIAPESSAGARSGKKTESSLPPLQY
jgi:hypothetical protein